MSYLHDIGVAGNAAIMGANIALGLTTKNSRHWFIAMIWLVLVALLIVAGAHT